jgi:antitoxin HicB
MHVGLPLAFRAQPEGGFTVTSPVLPELITEGDSFDDALENVKDALAAVIAIYREMGRELPAGIEGASEALGGRS